jgi:prevent-host-death family protein
MPMHIPEIRPISDLARDARALVERVRERHEPMVITQRGHEVAVLLPVELYRELESLAHPRVVSPRLARTEDALRFEMTMTVDAS